MTRAVLAVAAGLAWFLLVSLAASVATLGMARVMSRWPAVRSRPSFWLALRLLPGATSLLFVLAVFAPAFQRFEPAEAGEAVGFGLACLAAAALAVMGHAAVRGAAGLRMSARQARAWLRDSDEVSRPGAPVRIHCVRSDRPSVSLIGVFRPRLFITRPVVEALTEEELEAVVAHELEHRSAWDNLKRLVVLASPDLLALAGAGRRLEARWAQAVEADADRRAGRGESGRRLALASAILKVARLMPAATPHPAPVSDIYSGGPVAARVERLVRPEPQKPRLGLLPWTALGFAALAGWWATSAPVLHAIHHLTEFLVSLGG